MSDKPKLKIVEAHPDEKRQLLNLGERLHQDIQEYVNQEDRNGRMVTYNEIVGTLEFLKKRYLEGDV